MIKKSDFLTVPHGNTTIWRYMGLDKFIDLLIHKQLFFTNVSRMTDKYEGSIPRRTLDKKRKHLKQDYYNTQDLNNELNIYQNYNNGMPELTLLNCWSINRYESYALWKIYLDGSKTGVAIKTTVSKLKKALEDGKEQFPEDIYIGEVKYRDYIPGDQLNRFSILTTKNQFYKFENELRLFILNYPKSEGGHDTPYNLEIGRKYSVDINTLIDQIYLSPFAGNWFEDAFKKTIDKVSPNLANRIVLSEVQDQ